MRQKDEVLELFRNSFAYFLKNNLGKTIYIIILLK